LLEKLTMGERYSDVGDFYGEDPIVYKAIGSSWLDLVADKIADTIKRDKNFANNAVIQGMLFRLNEYKHNPESLPASDWAKVYYNISNGKWAYLADRFSTIGTGLKLLLSAVVILFIFQQMIFFSYLYNLLIKRRRPGSA
jgi:hypothetical protein